MTRAQAIKYAEFWRRAGVRWQEWSERLLAQPPNGLWGDDMSRELLARELRYHRSINGPVPRELAKKHVAQASRAIRRRLTKEPHHG